MGAVDRMIRAALLLLALVAVQAPARADPPIPQLTGRVVDAAHILDASTASTIDRQLAGYESSTTNQVVVVTLPDLKGYDVADWGLALIRGWGIGQKGKNNGVVLVVAPNQHRVRIEVGYGLEGQLPDATAKEIIDNDMIPRFKAGDYPGGIATGVNSILAALGGNYAPTAPPPQTADAPSGFAAAEPLIFCIVAVLVIFAMGFSRRYDPRRRVYGWYWAGYPGVSGGGSSRGGGFFSGGGGGGFSGGGGGGGGGGASGGW